MVRRPRVKSERELKWERENAEEIKNAVGRLKELNQKQWQDTEAEQKEIRRQWLEENNKEK